MPRLEPRSRARPAEAPDSGPEEASSAGRFPVGSGEPKLKGSIGEGPNHSTFSDQSSVRICQNSGDFARIIQNSKIATLFSTFSKTFGEN